MRIVVEAYLFDTCNHKCTYCHLAETGKVLDTSQLRPYRDPQFVEMFANFFNSRTDSKRNWLVTLTGGEPLLMPNLSVFCRELDKRGNQVALYSALLISNDHPNFRYLVEDGASVIDYIMASFHPEAEEIEADFFSRVQLLKNAGHKVIVRFVGHPARLDRMDHLANRCKEVDVAFHATPLFSPEYPAAYAPDELKALEKHVVSLSQLIQLRGGVETRDSLCTAGSKLIAVDMRTGVITPCISVQGPVLGNLYENSLSLFSESISCPEKGMSCICDIHFQQSTVHGADDSSYFAAEKQGFIEPKSVEDLEEQLVNAGIAFSSMTPTIGQTETAQDLILPEGFVRSAFLANQGFFEGDYSSTNHVEFRRRQFPAAEK